MENERKNSILYASILATILVVAIFAVVVFVVKINYSTNYSSSLLTADKDYLSNLWFYSNGDVVEENDNFHDSTTIYTVIPDDVVTRNVMSVRLTDLSMRVYIDNELYASYCIEDEGTIVANMGTVFVRLPVDSAGKTIGVQFDCEDGTGEELPEIYLSSSAGILNEDIENIIVTSVFVGLMLTVSLCLTVLFLVDFAKRKEIAIQLLLVSSVTFLSAVWVLVNSSIVDIFSVGVVGSTFVSFLTLMILPYPLLLYVHITCRSLKKGTAVTCGLCVLNIIVQLILYAANVVSLTRLVTSTHIVLLITLLVAVIASAKEYHDKKSERAFVTFCSMLVVYVLLAFEFVNHYINKQLHSGRVFFQMGMLLFIVFLASGTIKNLIEARLESTKLELYKKMSLEDSLTGLGSRAAYEAEIIELGNVSHIGEDIGVLFMDINFLKLINDTEGHLEGDRAIEVTANAIKKALLKVSGKAFRTGGDEFIVIIRDTFEAETVASMVNREISEYITSEGKRLSVSIGIITGTIEYGTDVTKTNILSLVAKADANMYLKKAAFKKETVIDTNTNG